MTWHFIPSIGRYYNDTTKRLMSREQAMQFVDNSLAFANDKTAQLAEFVAGGQLSPRDWGENMFALIKQEYIREYMFGRGGRSQMTQADWGSIGGILRVQNVYFKQFQAEIAAGNLSEAEIAARANMYINSARQAFERGRSRALGIPFGKLPAFPGDGQTECLSNDRCTWTIIRIDDEDGNPVRWECYWTLDQTVVEHCQTCLDNAVKWNPYIIEA